MNDNNLESIRRDLITVISKTENILEFMDSISSDIDDKTVKIDPLEWLDFRILVDRYQNCSTDLLNRCNDLK